MEKQIRGRGILDANEVNEISAKNVYMFPAHVLTKNQKQIIRYIISYTAQFGYCPTYTEIAHFFKKSRSTIHEDLNIRGISYNSRDGLKFKDKTSTL